MKMRTALMLTIIPWVLSVSTLHAWLNLDLFRKSAASGARPFRVGFLPVT